MKEVTKEKFLSTTRWYHGTIAKHAESIISNGVNAEINKNTPLDFGSGFYLAMDKDWATKYVRSQLTMIDNDLQIDADDGYVLEFEFSPKLYISSVDFMFFEKMNTEFADFVFDNRMNYDSITYKNTYDIVGGPMSDGKQLEDFLKYKLNQISKRELYERLLEPKEDWQMVLRTQSLCNELKLTKIYNLEGAEINVD